MIPKAERLTTKEVDTLSQGKSVFGTLISVRFLPSAKAKIAVSVSKKTLSRAVDRNKARRKVYDASRPIVVELKKPIFAMLMPKKEVLSADSAAISAEIRALFGKAGAL